MTLKTIDESSEQYAVAKENSVVCVVYLKVIGLSGILLDSQRTKETVSRNKDMLIPPRQMKASLAVVCGNQVCGKSPDSKQLRRLLPLAAAVNPTDGTEMQQQKQPTRRYIAVWDNSTIKTTATSTGCITATTADSTILFETTLLRKSSSSDKTSSQTETSSSLQQKFDLVVGLSSVIDPSKIIPIGVTSLPITDAAALRGSSGKVVLDLPIFNISQDTFSSMMNPFVTDNIQPEEKAEVKSKRPFLSRLRRSKNMIDQSFLAETQHSKLPCIYSLDSTIADTATLRVELELQEKESNVEIGLSSLVGSIMCSDNVYKISTNSVNVIQKDEIFLMEEFSDDCSIPGIEGIETSLHSKRNENKHPIEISDLTTHHKCDSSTISLENQSIERVLSTRHNFQASELYQSKFKFSPPRRFRARCVNDDKTKFKLTRICNEWNADVHPVAEDDTFIEASLVADNILEKEDDIKSRLLDGEIERVLSLEKDEENAQAAMENTEDDVIHINNNIPFDEQSFLSRDVPVARKKKADEKALLPIEKYKPVLPIKTRKFNTLWARKKNQFSVVDLPATNSINGTESSSQTASTTGIESSIPTGRTTVKKILLPDASNMLQSSLIDVPSNDFNSFRLVTKGFVEDNDLNWNFNGGPAKSSTQCCQKQNRMTTSTSISVTDDFSSVPLSSSISVISSTAGTEMTSTPKPYLMQLEQSQVDPQVSLEDFNKHIETTTSSMKPISILRNSVLPCKVSSRVFSVSQLEMLRKDNTENKSDAMSVVSSSAETEVFKKTMPKAQVDYEDHFNKIIKELTNSKKVDVDGPETDSTESMQSVSTDTTPPSAPTTYSSPLMSFVEEENHPIIWEEKYVFEDDSLIEGEEMRFKPSPLEPVFELEQERPLPRRRENLLAQNLLRIIDMQQCTGKIEEILDPTEEDATLADSWTHDNSTIGTYRSRKVSLKDDLADLGLLWGDMCRQVKYRPNDDDNSAGLNDRHESKSRWTTGFSSDSNLRSFWTRKASEIEETDECNSSEFSSGSFTDEYTCNSATAESESEFSEEGTEVNVNDLNMSPRTSLTEKNQIRTSFTPILRTKVLRQLNGSEASNKVTSIKLENKAALDSTVESDHLTLFSNRLSKAELDKNELDTNVHTLPLDLESTKEMVTRACLASPPKMPITINNDDATKRVDEILRNVDEAHHSDDEINTFSMPPRYDTVPKSITQSLVDLVEYVISPSPIPSTVVPPVVLSIDTEDDTSVGELTATTYEQQVDVDEMLRQSGQRLLVAANNNNSLSAKNIFSENMDNNGDNHHIVTKVSGEMNNNTNETYFSEYDVNNTTALTNQDFLLREVTAAMEAAAAKQMAKS